ncbi:DUF4846 domain-containing protein [Chishuiella changwenlii]|uniref:DUF4846 domain-containing protein n=1 Tax=Chishuiella changwenlii TaxID=1434701 RepID=UPI002FD8D9CF
MMKNLYVLLIVIGIFSCKTENKEKSILKNDSTELEEKVNTSFIQQDESIILNRYLLPKGYERENYSTKDFGYFLQHLPLKPLGSVVKYYDGKEKTKQNVYNSVIDLPIGNKDLHQCADATMRLRADYLYQQKRYDEIAFNYLSDGKPRYYKDYAKGDYSKDKYRAYLETIFSYANTASLQQQLKSITYKDVKIGDILIQKGRPFGHAVIVVDLAKNNNGEQIVLLAQSYMPAQELQILDNPINKQLSPWYNVKNGRIITPEWKFTSEDWKTWN